MNGESKAAKVAFEISLRVAETVTARGPLPAAEAPRVDPERLRRLKKALRRKGKSIL